MTEVSPPATALTPDHVLDVTGLLCPEPVMLLHKLLREIAAGQSVQVLATDPSTTRDIPRFCDFLGHELLEHGECDGQYRYLLRKQESAE